MVSTAQHDPYLQRIGESEMEAEIGTEIRGAGAGAVTMTDVTDIEGMTTRGGLLGSIDPCHEGEIGMIEEGRVREASGGEEIANDMTSLGEIAAIPHNAETDLERDCRIETTTDGGE